MPDNRSTPSNQRRRNRGWAHVRKACDFYEAGDFPAAEREFLHAAKLGNPEAQVNLGNIYSSNELGRTEFQKAIRYYKRAVLKGSPLTAANAATNLAITYQNLGKQRSYLFWMRRAADLGDDEAKEIISNANCQASPKSVTVE